MSTVNNILHITSGDLMAGAEVQLLTLATALQKFPDISVAVVLLNHGILESRLRDAGIGTTVIDETKLNGLQILYRLIKVIREHDPDVVHTHRIKENVLGSLSALLAGRVPSLRTSHGAPEHPPALWQLHKYTLRILDRLTGRWLQRRIIAVSDDLAGILEKVYPGGKIRVIENGIDIDAIRTRTSDQPPDSERQSATLRIGLAGRLVPVKRVDLFIETARYLIDHSPELNVSFHIYGDGPKRNELEKLNQTLKMDDFIRFEGHCDDIIIKLHELDLLLMTSDHEGMPMVLLEAMALQLPIIAHATGGIPTLLDHGRCGILVQDQSAAGYARAIHRLATSSQLRAEITGQALEQVSTHYSARHNASAYVAEYAEIYARISPA